jgi:hypothetical protein
VIGSADKQNQHQTTPESSKTIEDNTYLLEVGFDVLLPPSNTLRVGDDLLEDGVPAICRVFV